MRDGQLVQVKAGKGGDTVDPAMPPEAVGTSNAISKIIMDATKPLVNPLPDTCLPKREVMDEVRENWERYGIGRPVKAGV